ncbi:uncharacterized protein BXIN_0992 [Babesia sp. Xinjiang]|uniref:uncharacterized protein n=1 Tax=Babesia sp. Xinjiang TaxID=462227 RepID=UPI000A252708|nr:uncharacterized protein BXIN_0992 [Babesia sp. Xinjiang]ORM42207.1 hypothetical protein BXIN_0992 [Babesia sp. Xinjiang]
MAGPPANGKSKILVRALRRLEQAFSEKLKVEQSTQRRTRAVALGVVVANVASLVHVVRSLMQGVESHRELAKESWSIRYAPTICFATLIYFFTNPTFRKNLFCSTIYLDRLNFSLLDFNLRFCGKSNKLEFIS